jgi:bifunctional ADP-heptose synthase (sugar kinase/adenylyltransferase)
VNKGPGRPFFNDATRVKSIAALACVDYVVLVPYPAAVEAIECIRPHHYCKGVEYQDPQNDVTGKIAEDIEAVARIGGQVHYVGAVVYSSTKLINWNFEAVPKQVKTICNRLSQKCSSEDFRRAIERLSGLRVLVVGDIIFDRYTYVHVQGLTSKNRTLSSRYLDEEIHAGGALAIAKHISAFTDQVDVLSLIGSEAWARSLLNKHLPGATEYILRRSDFTTVVKQRFVEKEKRSRELNKLFALNILDQNPPNSSLQSEVCDLLLRIVKEYDLVIAADFGHGLLQEKVRQLIQKESRFLSLNCQTNSFNHGFNLINRQYEKADIFSLDEQELMLACGQRNIDYHKELQNLARKMGCRTAWVTRGAEESIGYDADTERFFSMPPLETQVVDTVGAGDAFFALASIASVAGIPLKLATFIGQLAGAQAVRIPGNRSAIRKDVLLRGGMNLLNI